MNLQLNKNESSFFSPTSILPVLGIIGGAVLGGLVSPKMALIGSVAGFCIMLYVGFKEENANVLARYKRDLVNKMLIAEVEGREPVILESRSKGQFLLAEVKTLSDKESELEEVISKLKEQFVLQNAKHDLEVERLKNEIKWMIYQTSLLESTGKIKDVKVSLGNEAAYTLHKWVEGAHLHQEHDYAAQGNLYISNSDGGLVAVTYLAPERNDSSSLVIDRGAVSYFARTVPAKLAYYPESSFKMHYAHAQEFFAGIYSKLPSGYTTSNKYALGATVEHLEQTAEPFFSSLRANRP